MSINSKIKDILTAFSPSSDFLAVASADGRIKIWDTLKSQLQTEFSNIESSNDASGILSESEKGHLSLDYKCMKWVELRSKKKKKHQSSLLVLGTGNGDALALDVSAGQLKWKLCDCHPGGVTAVTSTRHNSYIYTAGVDGMVCQVDSSTGSLLGKFKSSTKAITSLSISADGKLLAAASAQLKIFRCSDNKKIQKFSGHPVSVRCMTFSEGGNYVISSGVGEKYITIWKLGAGKKSSACCVLSMDQPAVLLDTKSPNGADTEGSGLYVLAISEIGLCYYWYCGSIEELRNSKPTKISLTVESSLTKINKGLVIFAAKFKGIVEPSAAQATVSYGSLVKPSFEKIVMQHGVDMKLGTSQVGVLLPIAQSAIARKGQATQMKVTALDRANAEDAILPLPKLYDHEKKRKHTTPYSNANIEVETEDPVVDSDKKTFHAQTEDDPAIEDNFVSVEIKLRAAGILDNEDVIMNENDAKSLWFDANLPTKKIRIHIMSMSPSDAYKLLEVLVSTWKTRSTNSKHILTWIYYILLSHSHFILSQNYSASILDALLKVTNTKCATIGPLLKLSGRLQMIMTQINKAGVNIAQSPSDEHHAAASEEEDEDEDADIGELVYGEEEDESESDNDENNKGQP